MCIKYTLINELITYELFIQDSDWEEVQTDGLDNDKEFLSSVSALGKPSYEHLEAMAKVFNEVWLIYHYSHIIISLL
jgi:hypothetical protein